MWHKSRWHRAVPKCFHVGRREAGTSGFWSFLWIVVHCCTWQLSNSGKSRTLMYIFLLCYSVLRVNVHYIYWSTVCCLYVHLTNSYSYGRTTWERISAFSLWHTQFSSFTSWGVPFWPELSLVSWPWRWTHCGALFQHHGANILGLAEIPPPPSLHSFHTFHTYTRAPRLGSLTLTRIYHKTTYFGCLSKLLGYRPSSLRARGPNFRHLQVW